MLSKTEGVSVQVSVIKNFKYLNTNTTWFDKLTTTLSQVEGQITMTDPPEADQTIGFWSYLRFGYCNLEFICNLMLVICYFWYIWVLHL